MCGIPAATVSIPAAAGGIPTAAGSIPAATGSIPAAAGGIPVATGSIAAAAGGIPATTGGVFLQLRAGFLLLHQLLENGLFQANLDASQLLNLQGGKTFRRRYPEGSSRQIQIAKPESRRRRDHVNLAGFLLVGHGPIQATPERSQLLYLSG